MKLGKAIFYSLSLVAALGGIYLLAVAVGLL